MQGNDPNATNTGQGASGNSANAAGDNSTPASSRTQSRTPRSHKTPEQIIADIKAKAEKKVAEVQRRAAEKASAVPLGKRKEIALEFATNLRALVRGATGTAHLADADVDARITAAVAAAFPHPAPVEPATGGNTSSDGAPATQGSGHAADETSPSGAESPAHA